MQHIQPPLVKAGGDSALITLTSGFTKSLAAKATDQIHQHKRLPEKNAQMFWDAVASIDLIGSSIKALKSEREAYTAGILAARGEDHIGSGHPLISACHDLYIGAKSIGRFDSQHKMASTRNVIEALEKTLSAIESELDIAQQRFKNARKEAGELMLRCVASGADQKNMFKHLSLLPQGFTPVRKFLDSDFHEVD